MLEAIASYIAEEKLFDSRNTLLLAVSGGTDSMCMADALLKLSFKATICHCNFNLRGEESDKEEKFVLDFFSGKAPVFSTSFDTKTYSKEQGVSIEMAARDLRYQWFQNMAEKHHLDYICTAHNADDAVETFFLNLARGTGIKGLTGIANKRGNIRRPLLAFPRKEILDYNKKNSVPFCTDSSNADTLYHRNKIRNQVSPVFNAINPNFGKTMQENMKRLSSVNSVYCNFIDKLKKTIISKRGKVYFIPYSTLASADITPAILYDLLQDFDFSYTSIRQALENIKKENGKYYTSKTHLLVHTSEGFEIQEISKKEKNIPPIASIPMRCRYYNALYIDKDAISFTEKQCIFLDADSVSLPLHFRKWESGDQFKPFGMKGKSKKVSDFLNESDLSILEKKNKYVLISNGLIIWVHGNRISDDVKITAQTKRVLKIDFTDIC